MRVFGDNSSGFDNIKEVISSFNNKHIEDLNSNLQHFLKDVFKNIDLQQKKITAQEVSGHGNGKPKAKFYLQVEGNPQKVHVFIKKGVGNSIHQEKFDDFVSYLQDTFFIDNSIIDALKLFHFSDGTTNNTGVHRVSSKDFEKNNPNVVHQLNDFFNTKSVYRNLMDRFLFQGTSRTFPFVDYVYHGSVENGVWASRQELQDYFDQHAIGESNALCINNVTYQTWNKNINHNPNTEDRRLSMQIKFGHMEDILSQILASHIAEETVTHLHSKNIPAIFDIEDEISATVTNSHSEENPIAVAPDIPENILKTDLEKHTAETMEEFPKIVQTKKENLVPADVSEQSDLQNGTEQGDQAECQNVILFNKNPESEVFTDYLRKIRGNQDIQKILLVRVTTRQYSTLSEQRAMTRADAYAISVTDNRLLEVLQTNNFYLDENILAPYKDYFTPIPQSGISIKLNGSENYQLLKLTVKSFTSLFEEYIPNAKIVGAGASLYSKDPTELSKNRDVLNAWNVSVNEIEHILNEKNYGQQSIFSSCEICDFVKKEAISTIGKLIDSSEALQKKIFNGNDLYEEPYTAQFFMQDGKISILKTIPYTITTGSGRSKGNYTLVLKPKRIKNIKTIDELEKAIELENFIGEDISGFQNEDNILNKLHGQVVDALDQNWKSFLKDAFPNLDINKQTVMVKKVAGHAKPDLKISIGPQSVFVSLKKGSGNSVHQERLNSFVDFLNETFSNNPTFSDAIVNDLKLFHYSDGSVDNTGAKRISTEDFVRENPDVVKRLNVFFNKSGIFQPLIERFLFEGANKQLPSADILYHGDEKNGVWVSRTKLMNFLNEHPVNDNNIFHINSCTYQTWNKNLKYNLKTENRREVMQIKFASMKNILEELKSV